MPASAHHGVAETDPRNAGPIAFFRPPEVTLDYVRQRLAAVFKQDTAAQIGARAEQFMADMARKTPRPPPPLSEPVESAPDPVFGLGVHPDIIEQLWALDRALPRSCRWLVWGHPALVHPGTGVIFAVAIGTIGIAARLPPALRDGAKTVHARRIGVDIDLSPAGPEWAFLARGSEHDQILAAHAFAEIPPPDHQRAAGP